MTPPQTLEQKAQEYANKPYYKNGSVLSCSPRLYIKRGYMAGHQSRDEEVKRLREALEKILADSDHTPHIQSIARNALK